MLSRPESMPAQGTTVRLGSGLSHSLTVVNKGVEYLLLGEGNSGEQGLEPFLPDWVRVSGLLCLGPVWFDPASSCGLVLECCQDRSLTASPPRLARTPPSVASRHPVKAQLTACSSRIKSLQDSWCQSELSPLLGASAVTHLLTCGCPLELR